MSQGGDQAALDVLHGGLHLGLVPGRVRPCRDDDGPIMGGHALVGRIQIGLVAAGARNPRLFVVGDNDLGDATEVFEGVDVAFDPVPLLGSGGGLGKGVVAGRQDGDKEVGLLLVAGIVQPGDGQPGPVDEGLFPGFVGVPQDDVDGLLPAAVVL